MSEMKTKRTDASVEEYLASIPDERKREDSRAIVAMMREVTGEEPAMWGDSIVGFGTYHYRYATGREGDWPLTGLAARKQAITVYITSGFDRYEDLLARLGTFKTGVSCLYIKRLSDVDPAALRELVRLSVEHMRATNS
jgi:hypothetical protein